MEVNGTTYNNSTPSTVISVLEWARTGNKRIRIFYGDRKTGRDWCEAYDTVGCIGRSSGISKVPILLRNRRSTSGTAILDDCIVKITCDHEVMYKHPNYHLPLKLDSDRNRIVDDQGQCFYRNDDWSKVIKEYKWFIGHYDRH